MEDYILRGSNYIKNSYAQLLLYYYKIGVGKVSEIAGVTITDRLINTIERRYNSLEAMIQYLALEKECRQTMDS